MIQGRGCGCGCDHEIALQLSLSPLLWLLRMHQHQHHQRQHPYCCVHWRPEYWLLGSAGVVRWMTRGHLQLWKFQLEENWTVETTPMGEGKVRPCSPSNTSGGERGVGGLRCFAGEVTPLADVMVLFPPFRLRSGSPNARQFSYKSSLLFWSPRRRLGISR